MRSLIGSSYPDGPAAALVDAALQRGGEATRADCSAWISVSIFPQTEVGGDRGAVRALGQAADDLGYAHLAAYDHVLGGDLAVHGDIGGPYTIDNTFREPLTMFAYLAGFTNLAFATSILIGPQRQTALLAKQAAEVDLLCGGTLPARARHRLEQARVRRARASRSRSARRFWRNRSPCCGPCGPSGA